MQAQFSKEHPLIKYEAVPVYTRYNEDGSKAGSYTGKKYGFKSKKEAIGMVNRMNDSTFSKK